MHAAMFMYFAMFVHVVIIEYLQLDDHEGHPVNPMFSYGGLLWASATSSAILVYMLRQPAIRVCRTYPE